MSHSLTTETIKAPVFLGTDKPSWLEEFNELSRICDEQFKNVGITNEASDTRFVQIESDITNLESSQAEVTRQLGELASNLNSTAKTLQDTIDELVKQVAQNATAIANIQRQLS